MASDLHTILDQVAEQMALDLRKSASIEHRASKGTVRERDAQRAFLEKYLPSVARVTGSGEIVSADGQVSGQCDLMVVDSETPPLWKAEDYVVVPAECCYAVIEVKSNLTVEELKKSWAAAKKAKSLPRTAFQPDPNPITYTRSAYGREWNALPFIHLVFAYSSATLETLGAEVGRLAAETDPALGVDAICVLDRGVISWQDITSGNVFMRENASLVFASEMKPGNVLLFMMTALHNHLANARYNPKFNIVGYIKETLGQVSNYWAAGGTHIPIGSQHTGPQNN